jgi:uncharacterized membrane protein HdeD (DUF308 family)
MDENLGTSFWLKTIGVVVAIGAAIFIGFVFITGAFARVGLIGGAVLICAVLLLFGWLWDRREKRRLEEDWGPEVETET